MCVGGGKVGCGCVEECEVGGEGCEEWWCDGLGGVMEEWVGGVS